MLKFLLGFAVAVVVVVTAGMDAGHLRDFRAHLIEPWR